MSRFSTVDYTIPEFTFAPWQPCPDCTGGPAPGARALLAYWLESYEPLARSLGIYNCRRIRGSSSLSIHACGRAVDGGVPVTVEGHRVAVEFWRRMAPHAGELGIQLLIFSRNFGSARNPWPTHYKGVHPHFDHWHGELTVNAGQRLTLATLRARVGDFRPASEPEPEPEPPAPQPEPPATDWTERLVSEMQRIDLSGVVSGRRETYVTGDDVRLLQAALAASDEPPRASFNNRGVPDGVGGPGTRTALGEFQRKRRTGVPSAPGRPDHVAGPATWGALLRPGRGG